MMYEIGAIDTTESIKTMTIESMCSPKYRLASRVLNGRNTTNANEMEEISNALSACTTPLPWMSSNPSNCTRLKAKSLDISMIRYQMKSSVYSNVAKPTKSRFQSLFQPAMENLITDHMAAKKPIGYTSKAMNASGNNFCHVVLIPCVESKYPKSKLGSARM